MRLPLLFAAFFLGLLTARPSASPHLPWMEILVVAAALGTPMLMRFSASARIVPYCIAAFFLGAIWMTHLPTWPHALNITGLPSDGGCTVIGRAVGEAVECPSGRCLPLALEAVRTEGFCCETGAHQGNWGTAQGVVLVRVKRDFVGVCGARYHAHGRLVVDPDRLHDSIALRYRPRGVLDDSPNRTDPVQMDPPSHLADISNRLRYRLMSHLSWGLTDVQGQLVAGITFGRRGRRLEGSWAGDFYTAGLSHLIVASGAQVSLLFLPVFFLLGRVRLPFGAKWFLLVSLAAALIGFARLLGGEPSILRAAAMGCVLLLALGMGRRVHPLATLASAGWFWLGQNPLLIRDTGFLLSLGASFGIIYLGPPLFDICVPTLQQTPRPPLSGGILSLLRDGSIGWFRQLLRFTVMCALVTFTAQLGVLPALACTVGRISVSGFFANLFAVPLGQMVLFLGALSGVSGFICPAFSLSINSLLGHLANALIAVAHDFAHLPLANTKLTPLPVWVALSYYATCVLLVERARLFRSPNRPSPPPAASSPVHPAAGTMISLDVPLPPEMH